MAPPRAAPIWALAGIAILFCCFTTADPSVPLKYCADVNTAEQPSINYQYQSQGRCRDNCTTASFALAIVQAHDCWCSNLVPNKADQRSLKDCQSSCPGYPSDYCGGDGTYGYMELNKQPSGTAQIGVINTAPPSSPDDDVSPTSGPVVQTVTVGGVIKTVTASPSSNPAQLNTPPASNAGLSTGATVGIAVGLIGFFALLAIGLFLWCLKRKRRQGAEGLFSNLSRRGSSPGMISPPKTGDMSESRYLGTDGRGGGVDSSGQNSNRRSNLMPIDPRLDPFAKGIYARDQNVSHDSINTIQDNRDYSRRIQEPPRVLRATNPDPDY